jgi:rubrerythrin
LANSADCEKLKHFFETMAEDEHRHEITLRQIQYKTPSLEHDAVIAGFLNDGVNSMVPVFENFDQAFTAAALHEDQSHKFYQELALATRDPKMEEIFLSLAQEESDHRRKFLSHVNRRNAVVL